MQVNCKPRYHPHPLQGNLNNHHQVAEPNQTRQHPKVQNQTIPQPITATCYSTVPVSCALWPDHSKLWYNQKQQHGSRSTQIFHRCPDTSASFNRPAAAAAAASSWCSTAWQYRVHNPSPLSPPTAAAADDKSARWHIRFSMASAE